MCDTQYTLQVQIRGAVPSVAIDKTDGFLCYLSKEALETTFTTSKSSEMNVSFPKPGSSDDELMEMPIPEQFVHTLKNVLSGERLAGTKCVATIPFVHSLGCTSVSERCVIECPLALGCAIKRAALLRTYA